MLIEILALIGAVASLAVIGCMLAFAWMYLLEFIDEAKHKYRYKHRFDKPPTAKCYCIDCKYHDNERGRCNSFGEFIADNCFCWKADPRKKEE